MTVQQTLLSPPLLKRGVKLLLIFQRNGMPSCFLLFLFLQNDAVFTGGGGAAVDGVMRRDQQVSSIKNTLVGM